MFYCGMEMACLCVEGPARPSFWSSDFTKFKFQFHAVSTNRSGKRPAMKINKIKIRLRVSASTLTPPPIDNDLRSVKLDMGAKFHGDIATTFGNDKHAIDASYQGIVIADLSHFGRIRVTGDDRIRFLHNQSTADFGSMKVGQGCDTVFLTPTARTIDLAYAWVMENATTMIVSPTACEDIIAMLNKYIFFADKVEVQNITNMTCFLSIMGPKSDEAMAYLDLDEIVGRPYGTHLHFHSDGNPMTVGVGSLLQQTGYSFMLPETIAGALWKSLAQFGAIPMGANAWETLRILEGRPAVGKELTNDYNVLEAGLWKTISTTKGCYIGQETITRLITYDGVKQHLWGLRLEGPATQGNVITVDDKKVGKLTSYAQCSSGNHVGLGYVRRQVGLANQAVKVGDVEGILIEVPFLSRSLPEDMSLGIVRSST